MKLSRKDTKFVYQINSSATYIISPKFGVKWGWHGLRCELNEDDMELT